MDSQSHTPRRGRGSLVVKLTWVAALALGLALALAPREATWAQPHQNGLRDTVNTPVASPTAGPTSTGTPTAGPCVGRVLLQEAAGVDVTQDTWINAYSASFPSALSGNLSIKGTDIQSALIRFNLTDTLPAGAEIIAAELLFYVDIPAYTVARELNVSAYRMLRPWAEGEACWNKASASVNWGADGANAVGVDRVGTPDDTVTFFHRAVYRGFNVTESVRYWLNHPSENYGWLIKGALDSTGAYNLGASRNSMLDRRPVLRIDYNSCAASPTPSVTPTSGGTPTPTITPTPDGGRATALVYNDLNRDGWQDEGEPGLPGVTVELLAQQTDYSWQTVNRQTTSDEGLCSFSGLILGRKYRIKAYSLWGYYSSGDSSLDFAPTAQQPAWELAFGECRGGALALPYLIK